MDFSIVPMDVLGSLQVVNNRNKNEIHLRRQDNPHFHNPSATLLKCLLTTCCILLSGRVLCVRLLRSHASTLLRVVHVAEVCGAHIGTLGRTVCPTVARDRRALSHNAYLSVPSSARLGFRWCSSIIASTMLASLRCRRRSYACALRSCPWRDSVRPRVR